VSAEEGSDASACFRQAFPLTKKSIKILKEDSSGLSRRLTVLLAQLLRLDICPTLGAEEKEEKNLSCGM
jgi:hypothetical protein